MGHMDSEPEASREEKRGSTLVLILIKILLVAAVLAALNFGGRWAIGLVEEWFMPLYLAYGQWATAIVIGIYIVLLALPFVPGIEVGLAIMMIFDTEGIALVYLSTLAALTLGFLVGRLTPPSLIARLLGWLHLERGRALVQRMQPLSPEEKLALLVESAPARIIPFLLRHRYLAVAAAFNIPGNFLIGGGGGIALTAGLSGLFRFPAYLLMVCIAISPVPLALLAKGWLWPAGG
ncbi:MAG: hypothetical protein IIC13_14720 [SAR324 cluster bacterium]|nr:hypothetical protein [SAR324 cluster bacterium]